MNEAPATETKPRDEPNKDSPSKENEGTSNETALIKAEPAKTHVVQTWKHERPLTSCRFDPLGRYVFAGTEDYAIARFRLSDGAVTPLVGHESWCRAIAFSSDGQTTITGGYDGRLLWWTTDADQPVPLRALNAHEGWIRAIAVSSDGKLIATAGNDRLVKLWDLAEGQPVATLTGHESHVYNVAFHPDGKSLVSCDLKMNFKHWNLSDHAEVRTFRAEPLHKYDDKFRADIGGARSLAFSADGKRLAAGGTTNVTNAFGGVLEAAVASIDWETGKQTVLHVTKDKARSTIWGLAWHPDGYWVGMAGGRSSVIVFWKPDQAQEVARFEMKEIGRDFALHPDALQAAVAMAENQIRICRLTAKQS